MNHLKKIIIGILVCTFGITLLTIPFLKKDNQTPKKNNNQINKKEISNDFDKPKSTNKVSKKKIFIIIGIVVIILIISLIVYLLKRRILFIKRRKYFLSKKCYFSLDNELDNEIIIGFGDEKINIIADATFFFKDISSEAKQQFKFYQILANDQNLKDSLIKFYELTVNFFFEIDGHLLKACYDSNNNSNTPLMQMSKNFNEKTLVNQKIYDDILHFNKTRATRDLSYEEEQLLNNNDYVNLFKTIMQQDTIPFYYCDNIQLPLFEYCHAIYIKIRDIYSELTKFFNKQGNEEHRDKYKTAIDDKMNKIKKFLEIKQVKNSPS